MRISGDMDDDPWGDEPEIQGLRTVSEGLSPEFPCLPYPGGQDIAFGLAIWKCDGHLDVAGDIT